jgi:hypothetical protein|tara:strand:- start:2195 stop:2425 length:231 start_codon:yes stop_codon:yes gene_type:complete
LADLKSTGSESIGVYVEAKALSIPGLIESDSESPNERSILKLSEQLIMVKSNIGISTLFFIIDFPLIKIIGPFKEI